MSYLRDPRNQIMRAIEFMVRRVRHRLNAMVRRGRVLLVNEKTGLQTVQVYFADGDLHSQLGVCLPYGFTAVPLPGMDALAFAVGAHQSHLVVGAVTDARGRPKGLPGETQLYTKMGHRVYLRADNTFLILDPLGSKIESKPDGSIEHSPFNGVLKINGNVTVTGNVAAAGLSSSGAITATGNVSGAQVADAAGSMAEMRTVYNGHTHVENNGAGGPSTNPPNQPMA